MNRGSPTWNFDDRLARLGLWARAASADAPDEVRQQLACLSEHGEQLRQDLELLSVMGGRPFRQAAFARLMESALGQLEASGRHLVRHRTH
jgi:hypothetical protein